MTVSVRRGNAADAGVLAEFAARTFRDTFAADNRPEDVELHLVQSFGIHQQSNELADSNMATILVEIDGALAGYAQLDRGPVPECVTGDAPIELKRFYVAKEWHGRGVAQTLMREVDAESRRRNANTLWLGVWERNDRARAFYRKLGFEEVGTHTFMLGTDAQTDCICVRPLEVQLSGSA